MNKPKVLLVDDDPDIVETIQFSLEQEGFEVLTAGDGVEGLARARQEKPDLIILDVMMPKENGYRVARMIRDDERVGKTIRRTPIILLTARNLSGDPDREKTFMEFSQADMMIYKPFDMDELMRQIHDMLAKSALG